jgi:hypothetical protein
MRRLLEIKHKLLLGHEWILECLTNSVDRGNSHFATQSCEPLLGSRSHQDSLEFCADPISIVQSCGESRKGGSVI